MNCAGVKTLYIIATRRGVVVWLEHVVAFVQWIWVHWPLFDILDLSI